MVVKNAIFVSQTWVWPWIYRRTRLFQKKKMTHENLDVLEVGVKSNTSFHMQYLSVYDILIYLCFQEIQKTSTLAMVYPRKHKRRKGGKRAKRAKRAKTLQARRVRQALKQNTCEEMRAQTQEMETETQETQTETQTEMQTETQTKKPETPETPETPEIQKEIHSVARPVAQTEIHAETQFMKPDITFTYFSESFPYVGPKSSPCKAQTYSQYSIWTTPIFFKS